MASTTRPLLSSGASRFGGDSRPRAASCRSTKRSADCTEATARSVSAAVTCITGQTPPMSHSAISSAASDFMPPEQLHHIGLALPQPTPRGRSFRSVRRDAVPARIRATGSRARHRRARDRTDRARLRAMPSRMVLARGNRANRSSIAAACSGARSVSQSARRCSALSGADTCGPSTNRAARQCRSASPIADEFMPPSVAHPAFEPQACRRCPPTPGSPASRSSRDGRR